MGGGATEALLDTQRVQLLWGTNNWLVVTNNGRVAVSGSGTYLAASHGNDATATRNGIRVTDGGVYSNAQAGVVLPFTLFGLAGSTGNVFEVTNGGRLEGWERFVLSTSAGNTLAFRGAATKQIFNVTNKTSVCTIDGRGTRLEVTDGATLEIKDGGTNGRGRFWMGTSEGSCSNVIHVAGAGSVLSCGSSWSSLIGQKNSCDNRVVISDGAKAVLSQLTIGQEGTATTPTARNVVRVETGGTLIASGTLTVGYGEIKTMNVGYAVSNRLEVASGGSVTAAGGLVVSTATNAYGNAVDIADGTVTVNEYVDFGRYGQASRITVRDGGRLTVGGNFNFGIKEGMITSNNVMHVLSGGEVLAKQFVVYGTNHALVVSNGTIRTADVESQGIQLPWYNNARDWDFTLEIAGTNPVLRAEGVTYANSVYVFGIRRGATVKFRVPENGFIEAPLQAPKGRLAIFWDANGNYPTFDFDVTACGHRYVVCPIAEGNPLTIDTPTWNYLKNNLPENCRLKYSDNRLTLYVNEQSTCILIR